jgi:hypothetical protein
MRPADFVTVAVILAAAAPSRADPAPPVPTIEATLAAAYAAAGLDRDPGPAWVGRARLAGLIPWLTLRTTRDTSWQDGHPEVGHVETLEARATWRLDRMLFDAHELQVAELLASRRRERRRIARAVIRAYFAWRRAGGALVGGGDEDDDDDDPLHGYEAVAELDALTVGWFSAQLGPRTP